MATQTKDVWSLVLDQPFVDAAELAEAVVDQVRSNDLDYRSRLLIRDSLDALRNHWGSGRIEAWLSNTPCRSRLEAIWREPFEERGFPFLKDQIMNPTQPETMLRDIDDYDIFLRKLSSRRVKDKQDLKVLIRFLDKETLSRKLKETCHGFLAVEKLREDMNKNWYVLYGEPLPA
jgi:hypothetical protein